MADQRLASAKRRPQPYSSDWFERRRAASGRSARVVLPLLLDLIAPRSVVDIGCGTGSWLAVARELGVEEVWGVDGSYVERSQLEIPSERFLAHDLTRPLQLGRHFDLALSLEVGEHLPASAASTFVDSLVRLAPVVGFSAAIPHQTGTGHVNEKWQDWWAERFAQRGYVAVDCVRPRLWEDPRVRYFYAQNFVLYVRESVFARHPRLAEERWRQLDRPLRVVHPRLYENVLRRFPPPGAVRAADVLRFGARLAAAPLLRRPRGRATLGHFVRRF